MRGVSPTKYAEFKVERLNDKLMGSARDLTSNFMDIKQRIRSKNTSIDPQRERFKPKTMFLQSQYDGKDSTKAGSQIS